MAGHPGRLARAVGLGGREDRADLHGAESGFDTSPLVPHRPPDASSTAELRLWNHVAMGAERTPYYRADLALIHHEGSRFHAEGCAPGILSLLESVRRAPRPRRRARTVGAGC